MCSRIVAMTSGSSMQSDDPQLAAALGADLDIDGEDAF
jgi:hypothetical protein